MKSICIKTNNKILLNYLLNELNYIELNPIIISKRQFKHYNNIIIHYKGNDNSKFVHEISSVLSFLVIDEFEDNFIKNIISKDYFYFDKKEKTRIFELCIDIFSDDYNYYFNNKFDVLINDFESYLKTHKSIILSGFINFRIKNYFEILNKIVDEAVTNFIIEKEYLEFISLLKMYINSQKPDCDIIHLIYNNEDSILLDKNKNIINISSSILKAKYLSDITFSQNDYILNTLLNLLPNKIYIHLVNEDIDEFINTLLLVFENRAEICTDCNICKIYKYKNKKRLSTKSEIKKSP